MKKSQVAWEWSRGVNPVRRRLTHSPKRSLFQFTLHCPVSFWQKQPSEKCYSTLVWKLNVSMQNIGVAINSCLHFVKFVQVCHFSPLHVVWFTRIWGINSCEYFFMQICERLWICPIHSSVKLNWRPKTVCTLHHSMEHKNNNSIRHPAVSKDPCNVFWESGSFLSALHSSRVHVVTQTGVKGRPACGRRFGCHWQGWKQ